jgi:hypothetical protein
MPDAQKILMTDLLNLYRECVRSIWNTYFFEQYKVTENSDFIESFCKIKQELFDSIVLIPVLADSEAFDYVLGFPCSRIKIIPRHMNSWDIPVDINRSKGEIGGYWDHPISRINSQADLVFIDFFDWNPYGFIDMSRIVAEILDYPENPSLIGHRLIVESIYVDFIFV